MGRGPAGMFGTNRKTLMEVRDWSEDPSGDLGRVVGRSRRSGMGRGPSGMSSTSRETFREVRD